MVYQPVTEHDTRLIRKQQIILSGFMLKKVYFKNETIVLLPVFISARVALIKQFFLVIKVIFCIIDKPSQDVVNNRTSCLLSMSCNKLVCNINEYSVLIIYLRYAYLVSLFLFN